MKRKLFATLVLALAGCLFAAINSPAAEHYVNANGANPTPPYTNWDTAATNIQDAVSIASTGDAIIVTNGVYPGTVSVTNPLALVSVNGPQFTVIDAGRVNRCAFLAAGASLTGFTLTNGWRYATDGGGVLCSDANAFLTNCVISSNRVIGYWISGRPTRYAPSFGGGVYGGTLYNCTLTGNSADVGGGAHHSTLYHCTLNGNRAVTSWTIGVTNRHYFYGIGGGVYGGTLYNCTLTGNSASFGGGAYYGTIHNCTFNANWASSGGGTSGGTLYNCTITGNSATSAGGANFGMLYNCIVCSNTAPDGANYDTRCVLNYCCTTPLPTNGVGNITNAPLFVDYAGGNLRLQSNSPCINSGNNAYVTDSTDLDGRPRIVGGIVDMGAYEFQPGVSGAFIGWLQQYGLPTDGSADFTDADSDSHNNWQEWHCGTCPTNNCSVLRLLSACCAGTNVVVTWQSVTGVNYFVECSTNLAGSPCFTCVATNLLGAPDLTTFTHTNAVRAGSFFYRVGVRN